MPYEVNFKELKQEVSIADVLTYYGYPGVSQNSPTSICAICSNDTLKVKDSGWKCHACNEGGNILDLVQKKEKLDSIKDAALFIVKNIKPKLAKQEATQPTTPTVQEPTSDGYKQIFRIVISVEVKT